MFGKIKPYATNQKYVWVAEYTDGYDIEIDNKGVHTPFKKVNIDKVIRLGLIGQGYKGWIEVNRGVFNLRGSIYTFIFSTNQGPNKLNNRAGYYSDIYTRKRAEMLFGGVKHGVNKLDIDRSKSNILDYRIGLRTTVEIDEVPVLVDIECVTGNGFYFDIRLKSDKELIGVLTILKDGEEVADIGATLRPNEEEKILWDIR